MAQTSRRIGSNRPVCLWLALLPLLCAGAFANAQNGAQRAGGGPPPSYSGGAGRSSGFQARSFGPTADYNAMNARLARSFGYVSGFLPPIRHTGTGYSYAAADAGSERRSGTNAPPYSTERRAAELRGPEYRHAIPSANDPISARVRSMEGAPTGPSPVYGATLPNDANSLGGRANLYRPQHRVRAFHRYPVWFSNWSGDCLALYPYYCPAFDAGITALSPYAFYYGSTPPFIDLGAVVIMEPAAMFVPVPVYANGYYSGWEPAPNDDYYLNQPLPPQPQQPVAQGPQQPQGDDRRSYGIREEDNVRDQALAETTADIQRAWTTRSISLLAKHLHADGRIAIYLRGKYQYSLDGEDYLDLTQDAFRATQTVRFQLDDPVRSESGVYTVTGTHVYRDKHDSERTVHLSFVLERDGRTYAITQIGTAPDRAEE